MDDRFEMAKTRSENGHHLSRFRLGLPCPEDLETTTEMILAMTVDPLERDLRHLPSENAQRPGKLLCFNWLSMGLRPQSGIESQFELGKTSAEAVRPALDDCAPPHHS